MVAIPQTLQDITIAFVHDWLNGMRGGEKVLEVLCGMFPSADIYTLLYEKDKVSQIIRDHRIMESSFSKLPFSKRWYRYYLPLIPGYMERLKLQGYDLVVSVSHCVAHGATVTEGCHVAYSLSPMRYVWDMKEEYFYHGCTSTLKKWALDAFTPYLKRWDKKAAAKLDGLLCISDYIRSRIQISYGRDAAVVYPPVDTDFYCPGKDKREDFYLVASALVPYKRVDIAVQTFSKLGIPLVVVGTGPDYRYLKEMAAKNVSFLEWVEDDYLRELYRKAKALIFTSTEDFGIVPLEAQACGCPVIAYKKGGVLETVQEEITGTFFEEQTPDSLMKAVTGFDPSGYAVCDMTAWTSRFSKDRFAKEFIQALSKCYNDSSWHGKKKAISSS